MSAAIIPHNKAWYEEAFRSLEGTLNGSKKSSVHTLRKESFSKFSQIGFPSTKNEDWKYTDISSIARSEYRKVDSVASINVATIAEIIGSELSGLTLFVMDGRVTNLKEINVPTGVTISSIADISHTGNSVIGLGSIASIDNVIVALNSSFFEDGVAIEVGKGVVVTEPIHIISISSGAEKSVRYPRVQIRVGSGASISVGETHLGLSSHDSLSIPVTEVEVAANGRCEHSKLVLEGGNSTHLGHTAVKIERDGYYRSHCLTFAGSIVRNEISPLLNGENIECHLQGLTVIGGEQHVDNHTVLDHAKPHCHSDEMYKGIYSDKSSGVFSGTIIVREDAQKTDAIQSNQSILLSPTAKIETRPQLKIWADDVKCTHGATVGQLDEDAMFYLRARGIGKDDAQKILLRAFAEAVLNEVPVSTIKEAAFKQIAK